MLDYQTLAVALGGVTLGLLAVIWGQVSSKLDHMSQTLDVLAQRTVAHGVRLDHLERVAE